MKPICIIIGASHAAAQLIVSLGIEGWDGQVLVISDEPHLPYNHPPLSKAFLSGDQSEQDLLIRKPAFYEQKNIDFKLNTRVEAIDRKAHTITLSTGETLTYDKLALCTGARVRRVDLPGVTLPGIHYLRDLNDVLAIRNHIQPGQPAVIVGGGYIGLEAAASLTKMGMQVTLLELAPRILARVTAPEMSEFYARIHREEGVQIATDVSAEAFEGNGSVETVICSDGRQLPASLVIIGVGVIPNVELAQEAGLKIDNGILVDSCARSSDPTIVAAGDVTNHFLHNYQKQLRLESVPNAVDQAKAAAAAICGKEKPYCSLPWFWSDQFDLKLQIAGLSQGYDQIIIRGDIKTSRSVAVFYFKQGKFIAADCVNRAAEFMVARKALSSDLTLDLEKLSDENVAPKDLIVG